MRSNKRAISPVIVTVLLILLALVLAAIIFLWARGFLGEQVAKFDKPIEQSCPDIRLTATKVSATQITVSNNGNVPVFKLAIREKSGSGAVTIKDTKEVNLIKGMSTAITITAGTTVDFVPILLGKTEKGKTSEYSCLSNAVSVE